MFYIPDFNSLEEILEYEKKFLNVYKKSANSSGFYQMERIKAEIDEKKKQFLNKETQDNAETFNDILNIG